MPPTDFDRAPQRSAYASYLCLSELLALQHPRTPSPQGTQWVDEHLFITVHQAAEVLLGHALVELRRAGRRAEDEADADWPVVSLRRVTALFGQLEGLLGLLDTLTAESFAAFRPLLGDASAGQSSQFAQLFGQMSEPHCGVPSSQADRPEVSAALTDLRSAATTWKRRHLALVERMIGDAPGTGGTAGLAYLRSRI
ncbi:tryptophan 2,3-dioxygenase family protein [Streptomyces sp. NPDC006368]|uniref:tryptophan 2,3-dioxygenase family protein n=1 Tax=Streptomyces sp. NPDC006368 TaxID=3156760 RepID=UPI0033A29F0E